MKNVLLYLVLIFSLVATLSASRLADYEQKCKNGEIKFCNKAAAVYSRKKDYVKSFKLFNYSCENGSDYACYRLAYLHKAGKGARKNIKKAKEIYENLCDKKYSRGCLALGHIYKKDGNLKKTLEYFKKACDISDKSCNSLALLYDNGWKVQRDVKKAVQLYARACAHKSAYACSNLAKIYKKRGDFLNAARLYDNACLLFNRAACEKRDVILDRHTEIKKTDSIDDLKIYDTGIKISGYRFVKIAKKSTNKQIDYINRADTRLYKSAKMFAYKGDSKGALESYKESCYDEEFSKSCSKVIKYYSIKKATKDDFDKAVSISQKICKKGDATACYELAKLYSRGSGVQKDIKKATLLYEKGCKLHYTKSCMEAAKMYNANKEYDKALMAFEKACSSRNGISCNEAGKLYKYNKKSIKNAIKYFKAGCELRNGDSCFYLGEIYEDSDKSKAKKFYQKSCRFGQRVGCLRAHRL